jgi:SAM-dependent methyltransferase
MDALLTCRTDPRANRYRASRIAHWDAIAQEMDRGRRWGRTYHRRLAEVYRFLIPPGQRVLEIGCGDGRLLAHLDPSVGVGIDFSPAMLDRARRQHPAYRFVQGDAQDLDLDETFDFVILSDLVNDLWDVQTVLERVRGVCHPGTRLVLNTFRHLWATPLALAARLGLAQPRLRQNWLSVEDLTNLLRLSGFEVVRAWPEVLWPVRTPLLDRLCNRFLVKLFPFKHLALTHFFIARPVPEYGRAHQPEASARGQQLWDGLQIRPTAPARSNGAEPTVSVIVPARNEAGNVEQVVLRTPELGGGTEILFVEGHSTDDTWAAIEQAIAAHPERNCRLLRQAGKGKGDAVRLGFEQARGDIVMILDADLSVAPEDLTRFYEAVRAGRGEFINGVRLVYPMEGRAMRFFNLLGNKFFSLAFSWLLGASIKDTLCGTKALWKRDYDLIAANRHYFGDFDPFGDFDLLFGAARLNLKIVDMPIRYRERTYGATNIQRWKHGWMLLNMVLFAANRIKFV